ncbi:protein kinase [Kribbella sp. NPDC049227]|uniref:serine/threonine-protein kinase n=1 Tax=Kribbella sp. NPDC049227 TaxID=3364113 RepID=UPI003722068B
MEAFAGRYRLIDLIGTGGMGSVWRAWDLRRSAYVAAKVLGQHDAATLLRFVREQSVRIQHPHVVAPHGWAADDDKVVFAMDLVRGGSVATLLGDHGPLPASYVAVLLDQLLHGLSAVHAAGVVHRDLKPANLLLDVTGTGRPHLRLSDFGVAGLIGEPRMTRTSTILGTPGYLAPEQLAGADPDPRQDLYTIGAVALELLTGQRPTPSPLSPTTTPPANAAPRAPAEPPGAAAPLAEPLGPAAPPAPAEPLGPAAPLDVFIRRCMATDPSERPESADAAARLLAESGLLPPAGETPWANHPESPEVFDQLPPLPSTWTPIGPAPQSPPPRSVPHPTQTPRPVRRAQPTPSPEPHPRPQPAPSPEPAPPPQPTRASQPPQATQPARVAIAATAPTAQPPAASAAASATASAAAAQPSAAPHPDTQPPHATQPTRAVQPTRTTQPTRATADPLPTTEKSKASRKRRALAWVAAGCFASAAALLGSAAWLLLH